MISQQAAIVGIAALATAGVITRPFAWPEAVWAVAGALALALALLGLVPIHTAIDGVARGSDVYLFLIGMMLLGEVARHEGLFDWLAALATRLAKGSATRLFLLVYGVGVVVTVFLSNDATAVVLTPAVAAAARAARVEKPMPFLLLSAFVANAASFVLPISNPANLVVYGRDMPRLGAWLAQFAIPSVVAIVATYAVLRFVYRRDPGSDPLGHHALGLDGTRRSVITRINRDLARKAGAEDVGFVNLALLASRMGTRDWFDDRGWYMAKMPFAPDTPAGDGAPHRGGAGRPPRPLAPRHRARSRQHPLGRASSATTGVDGIVLGGGTAGEAFQDFQVALKEMSGRGIVLAVCSKNDRDVALAPFREHPEMVLKEEDIAAFVANWEPKSKNIRSIAETLGLGLASLTFLDDNPYERAEVRRALPRGRRADPAGRPDRLPRARWRNIPTSSRRPSPRPTATAPASTAPAPGRPSSPPAPTRSRTTRPASGCRRGSATSTRSARPRVVQLMNKTNQFNLTTRRRNRAELEAFLAREGCIGLQVRLADRFADHGLIAVALAGIREGEGGRALEIDTLLMSCRVLGRGVESLVLAELARLAAEAGCVALPAATCPRRATAWSPTSMPVTAS